MPSQEASFVWQVSEQEMKTECSALKVGTDALHVVFL